MRLNTLVRNPFCTNGASVHCSFKLEYFSEYGLVFCPTSKRLTQFLLGRTVQNGLPMVSAPEDALVLALCLENYLPPLSEAPLL